jgi:tetratricopeptide (TPR) repeat protein
MLIKILTLIIALNLLACSLLSNSGGSGIDIQIGENISESLDQKAAAESEAFHSYLVGELSYINQDFDTAQKNFAKTSALVNEPVPSVHEKLAELYIRSGKVEEALSESKKLLNSNPNKIEYKIFHAGILEATGENLEAIKLYKEVLISNKDKPEIFILLANAQVRNKDLIGAEETLAEALKYNKDSMLLLFNIARVYDAQGKTDSALQYYQKTFNIDKTNSIAIPDIFRILLTKEKIIETENFAKLVLDHQPQNTLARKILSQVLLGNSKLNEALEQISELEKLDQDIGANMRLKIAMAHFKEKNFKEAINQLLLVLADEPENGEARFYLASLYASSGRVSNALEEIVKVKTPQTFYLKARVFEAFLWKQKGDLDKAEDSIRLAYEADPNNIKSLYYLIAILKDANKLKEAKKYLEKALEIKPNNEKLLFQYGVLLHDLADSDEAIKVMEQVIKINPKNSDALNFIAYSLSENNTDLDRALTLSNKALEIKKDDPYYLDTLAWIYFKRQEYTLAKEYIEKSLKLISNDTVIIDHYADILLALNLNAEALKQFRIINELINLKDNKSPEDLKLISKSLKKIKELEEEVKSQITKK